MSSARIVCCIVCQQGEPVFTHTTIILERGDVRVVVEQVPAQVCPQCGEAYLSEPDTLWLLRHAEAIVDSGAQTDISTFCQ